MIAPSQFDEFIEALTEEGFVVRGPKGEDSGLCKNNPTNLLIRGIAGAELATIFAILPPGVWPDVCMPENPSPKSRSPSNFILIFRKDKQVDDVPKKTKGKGGGTASPDEP